MLGVQLYQDLKVSREGEGSRARAKQDRPEAHPGTAEMLVNGVGDVNAIVTRTFGAEFQRGSGLEWDKVSKRRLLEERPERRWVRGTASRERRGG